MALYIGAVWNLLYCLRSSVPIKRMPQNFYPGEVRSGQFRGFPIISLWGKMKMLPVSHKPTETTQLLQYHGHSPHLWWSGCNWRSGVTGRSLRSNEVKWGHNPFFANNSRRMEIQTHKRCQTTWPKLLTLSQIWSQNVTGLWRVLPNAFFRIRPS